MEAHCAYDSYPILSCGPDWITCTENKSPLNSKLYEWAVSRVGKEIPGRGQLRPGKVLGYTGHRGEGFFLGQRPGGTLLQLSGPLCTPLGRDAIAWSDNVSRLDLQVTVWTEGEQPHLARWTRDVLDRCPRAAGRPPNYELREAHPEGESLTQGKRTSASYGRLYDKTAEGSLGPPRLLWRYEVEWKGRVARQLAVRLAATRWRPAHVCKQVHAWYTKRGVEPSFEPPISGVALSNLPIGRDRDPLDWLRRSVSVTIKRAINEHGTETVVDALGLSYLLGRGDSSGTT